MNVVVIDSNVIINWLLDPLNKDSQDRSCVEYLIQNEYELVAPKLLLLEVMGILCWRYKFETEVVGEMVEKVIRRIGLWVDSDLIDHKQLIKLMYEKKLTSYDAWYFQVAKKQDCLLITHDKALLKADEVMCVTPGDWVAAR